MLSFFDGLRWEWVADGVQVLMCGVILACLLHNKLRRQQLLPASSHSNSDPVFFREMQLQILRQQTEQTLTSIRTTVETEQAKLLQLMEAAEAPWPASAGSEEEVAPEHAPFRLGDGLPYPLKSFENRYHALGELADQGLTVRQIAAQTRLPAGEVDLALKLQRIGMENGAAAMTRQ